jgi:hypothetical protein
MVVVPRLLLAARGERREAAHMRRFLSSPGSDKFSCTAADERAEPIPHIGCGCCNPRVSSTARRIDLELTRPGFIAGASLASLGFAPRARAQAKTVPPVVFSNFMLFDGKSTALRGGLRLLVEAGGSRRLRPTISPLRMGYKSSTAAAGRSCRA